MKKTIILIVFCFAAASVKSQIEKDPAHWAYAIKKLSGNTYELHLQASIDSPWHIYAQKQGRDFVGTPTMISLKKMAGVSLVGNPVEHGKKELYRNQDAGISNYEFQKKVDFVQKLIIKPGVKKIQGSVTYQTCTDTHCLSANELEFTVPVTN